ncbi:hypothetical protein [Sphaerochaeta halotolerans]|uniref:hypothetical protein n=1 Tax=Sphaerochaeta halotolerans TaxID=2293840 RepID=UPI00136E69E1|nr:hypothetical protein [Sphaerochaeta halotolerans]MXI85723.1 hypothetical protein [Sphaerochaeta halotolerans]
MKRFVKVVLVFALMVFLSGCATTVKVRHLVPGEVDLGGERSLAIASTSSYRFPYGRPLSPWVSGLQGTDFTLSTGFETNLSERVASLATRKIVQAVSDTRYFSILVPEATDAYLSLSRTGKDGVRLMREKGFDLLMSSEISYMDVEERVEGTDLREFVTNSSGISSEQVTKREYYLIQEATLGISYTITRLHDGGILVRETVTDKEEKRTKIGTRYYGEDGTYRDERNYSSGLAPSFGTLFSQIIERITDKMVLNLAPSWETEHFPLMKNKEKLASAEIAHEFAKNGEYRRAYQQFLSIWQQSRQLSSGYNASLMLATLGELQASVDLMNEVYNSTGDERVHDTLLILQQALSQDQLAQRQISGDSVDDGQGVTMTQYMVME